MRVLFAFLSILLMAQLSLDAQFGNPIPILSFPEGTSIQDLQLADVDNDGDEDILFKTSDKVILCKNKLFNEDLDTVTIVEFPEGFYINQTFGFAELNNDGWLDIYFKLQGNSSAPYSYFLNNGDGTFSNMIESDLFVYGSFSDYDSDGDGDFIYRDYFTINDTLISESDTSLVSMGYGVLLVRENDNLYFNETVDTIYSANLEGNNIFLSTVVSEDFNGNGMIDLLIHQYEDSFEFFLTDTSRYLLLSNTGNDYEIDTLIASEFDMYFNGDLYLKTYGSGLPDGNSDFIYYRSWVTDFGIQGYETYYLSNTDDDYTFNFANNNYNGPSFIPLTNSTKYLFTDYNNDGLNDLIEYSNNGLYSHQQIDSFQYAPFNQFAYIENLFSLNSLDFDEDEYDDLIITYEDENGRYLSWMKNTSLLNELYSNPFDIVSFWDENENGSFDDSELVFDFPLNTSNGLYLFHFEEFDYIIFDEDTVALSINGSDLWEIQEGLQYEIYLDSIFNDTTFYFPLTPIIEITSQSIDLTSSIVRCNQNTNYWLTYTNTGTTINDGYVQLIPDSLAIFDSANPMPDSTAGDTLFWFYEDLYPTHSGQIHLVYEMLGVDFLGENVFFEADVQTWEGLGDAKATTASELVCAYDPNDKLVTPTGVGQEQFTLFGDTLEYTIRFQNTGNDTAFTVIIRDTLDTHLDLSSFRPISSSHNVQTILDGNNHIATFTFEDIYLPDSFVNEMASHGFVKFQILIQDSLSNFTTIENTAGIYFDFNPPIVTNTVLNTFAESIPTVFYGKILLEGCYDEETETMSISDDLPLPLTHPYNSAPWNYQGTEALLIAPINMIDWVLVEVRSGTASPTTPATEVVERHVGLLLDNGEIVNVTGNGGIRFLNLIEGESYHFVIRHRNHLDVMTAFPMTTTTDVFYDFTQSTASALGLEQLKPSSNEQAMMYAGDANGDGLIQTTDFDQWFQNNTVINTYSITDFNLDGIIQVSDFDLWFINKAKIGAAEIQY